MKDELLMFKRRALRLGLCEEYRRKWDSCNNHRALINLALDANGVEFLSDALSFGWGLSDEELLSEFGEYINGRYVRYGDGYTSELYVRAVKDIKLRSTLTVLAGSCCDVMSPDFFFGRIYVCSGSKVRLHGGGKLEVCVYGDGDVLCDDFGGELEAKRITESVWVRGIKEELERS